MATWVEDIIQALTNLGGQATLSKIYEEVKQIREEPLPVSWKASVRERIEAHSSDSKNFRGKDYFRKIKKGTWALKKEAETRPSPPRKKQAKNQKYKKFSTPESVETISNYLKTIKEYRDYTDPKSASWLEYIREIFHIIGFSTEIQDSRLIFLKDLSGNDAPKAVVIYSFPNENYNEILQGLNWESYLLFAANYYNVEWGILTNGLKLKVISYGNHKDDSPFFWSDLDGIIRNQNQEAFFSIYKVFSYLKNQKKEQRQKHATRHELRLEFWKDLIHRAKAFTPRFSNIAPSKENWISTGAGTSGFNYAYVIRMRDAQVELYIDQGDAKSNKQSFDKLYAQKERIEQAFGQTLDWQRLDEKRASRVRFVLETSGLLDKVNWPELQDRMIEAMVMLDKTFTPEIRKLK